MDFQAMLFITYTLVLMCPTPHLNNLRWHCFPDSQQLIHVWVIVSGREVRREGVKKSLPRGRGGGQLRDTSFKERAGEEFGHLMENKKYIIFFFC